MHSPPARHNAVVLLSGGLDSTTTLHVALEQGYSVHALSFDYSQIHRCELDSARAVAARVTLASHRIVQLDPSAFHGSALTDRSIAVPRHRNDSEMRTDIPVTYVPARNTVFLAHALALAEVLPARDIFIGVNVLDASGYPDCRPAYLAAFEQVANLGTRAVEGGAPYRIHAPLVALRKSAIITLGTRLGVDYALTHSCYDPDAGHRACGACDACQLRARGFHEAGIDDPTHYISGAP